MVSFQLLAKNKNDVSVHLIHAQASVFLKHFEEAQMHLTEVSSSGSFSAKVTLQQARILSLSGEKEKAIAVLESLAPDAKDAEVWLDLAELHKEVGKQTATLTDLMEVTFDHNINAVTFQLHTLFYLIILFHIFRLLAVNQTFGKLLSSWVTTTKICQILQLWTKQDVAIKKPCSFTRNP